MIRSYCSITTRANTLRVKYIPEIRRLSKSDIDYIKHNCEGTPFKDIVKNLSMHITRQQYSDILKAYYLKGRGQHHKCTQKEKAAHSKATKKFKSKTLSLEEVNEIIEKLNNKTSITKLCGIYHLDRTTLKKWIVHYGFNYDNVLSQSNTNKMKSVFCIETNNVYINATEAAKSFNKNTNSLTIQIKESCKHNTHTAAGYHWRYIEES